MRPPTSTADLDPRHAHEYGPDGRSRFTCTLCGAIATEQLFIELEAAEEREADIYEVWLHQQGVLVAFKAAIGLDPLADADPFDNRDAPLLTVIADEITEVYNEDKWEGIPVFNERGLLMNVAAARAVLAELGERLKAIETEHDERYSQPSRETGE